MRRPTPRSRTRLRLAAAASLALLPLVATADEMPIESLELESLLDLSVRAATKAARPLSETPAVGDVVVRGQVEDYAWLSFNDILYAQPGFFPAQDFERRTVGARGEHESWNNNRLLMLVDGLPHNDVEAGTAFTWDITPLFFTSRVEILRGPGSALYGSYALNGVLAIDTVSPADLGGTRALGKLRLGTGGIAIDALASVQSTFADVVVAFNRYQTSGDELTDHDGSGRRGADGQLERITIHDGRDSRYLFLKAEGKGALSGFTLSLHDHRWGFDTGRGWLYFTPDREDMNEARFIASLAYRSPAGRPWRQEYAVLFQQHSYDENVRLYPAGALDGFYPGGVTERMDTGLESLFARAQVARSLPREAAILAGVEVTALHYGGDDAHGANADILDPDGVAPPFTDERPLGPTYEPILDRIVTKIGAFGQLTTGRLLGSRVELTAGLRYDNLFFDYTDLDAEGRPTRSKSFQDLSPRLALIFRAAPTLTLKLMAARAFRTPTPVELFIANTWTAASTEIETLQPERQDTYEAAADWRLTASLSLRANAWLAVLDNEIGYNASDDEIVNRYDNVRAGGEAELLFDTKVGGARVDGWLSYSLAQLLDETVADPGLVDEDHLTRAPSQMVKAGVRLVRGRLTVTLQGMWVGAIDRRVSDLATEDNRAYRPDGIPAWIKLDASAHVRFAAWGRVGISASNLFGGAGRLAAPLDAPFDYRLEPRKVMMELSLEL